MLSAGKRERANHNEENPCKIFSSKSLCVVLQLKMLPCSNEICLFCPVSRVCCIFPGTGPVTYEGKGNGKKFEKAIDSLSASGGGDCPELTFKGILNAMRKSPKYGSPMYVFTDASAKDYSIDNMDDVLSYANREFGNGITINFFTTGLCGKSSYKPFEELAKETCGYMFNLPKSNDLKKLSGITAGALVGATCLESGGSNSASGKKRRSVRGSTYSIIVDDSTEKIFITVVRQGSSQKVALKDPNGRDVTLGVTKFLTLVIYEINNPLFGTWKLAVSGSGKHSYQVKGVSKTNVDFEYFFIMIPSHGRGKPIPISHPLLGEHFVSPYSSIPHLL